MGSRAWLIAVGIACLAFEVGALALRGTAAEHIWADAWWLVVDVLALVECARTWRRSRRRAWLFFTLAITTWTGGMLWWAFAELVNGQLVPFPSATDVLTWLGLPCFVAGLYAFSDRERTRALGIKQVAELVLVGAAVVAVSIALLAEPAASAHRSTTYVAAALMWPIANVTALVFGMIALRQHVAGPRRRVLAILLGGTALLALTNVFYAEALLAGRYVAGSWTDGLWVVAFLALATSARMERAVREVAGEPAAAPARSAWVDLAIPTGAILAWMLAVIGSGEHAVAVEGATGAALVVALGMHTWAARQLERDLAARIAREQARAGGLEARLAHVGKLEAVGTLAGGVAHDFNNVLAAATAGLVMLRRKLARGASVAADLDELEATLLRAADLTSQLLDLGRRKEPKRAVVDPRRAVARVHGLLAKVLPPGVALDIPADDDAKAPSIFVDPVGLEHALLNLGLNARDALSATGTIAIAIALRGERVELAVRDDGTGIDPAKLPHLFEPFFTTKRDSGGTGLGLAMVHAFVVANGGEIAVASELGRGATFTLSFPRVEPVVVAPAAAEDTGPIARGSAGTIAVVALGDATGLATTGALERRGYATVAIADPADAAARVAAKAAEGAPIEAILIDAATGAVGGEVIRVLRAVGVTAPLVLVTGAGEVANGDWAALVGKPVEPDVLLEQVARVIRERDRVRGSVGRPGS